MKLLAEAVLDNAALKDLTSKNGNARRRGGKPSHMPGNITGERAQRTDGGVCTGWCEPQGDPLRADKAG